MAKLRIVLTDNKKGITCDGITGLDNIHFKPVIRGRFQEKILLSDIVYIIPIAKKDN